MLWDRIVSPVIYIFHIPVASIVNEARIFIRIVSLGHFLLSLRAKFQHPIFSKSRLESP